MRGRARSSTMAVATTISALPVLVVEDDPEAAKVYQQSFHPYLSNRESVPADLRAWISKAGQRRRRSRIDALAPIDVYFRDLTVANLHVLAPLAEGGMPD